MGGGMRGVVCGGMVAALEHIGLTQGFDEVIGSSAGAIAGAYFVAGQAAFGTRIFYEEINNRRFIAKRRLFLGKPVVSVDFLLDEVCRGPKELDWQAVLTARSRLVCVASSLDRRQSAAIAHFADKEALFHALKASARIPGVAGPPVVIDGERFVDAGVYENIPYATARARGRTPTAPDPMAAVASLNICPQRSSPSPAPPAARMASPTAAALSAALAASAAARASSASASARAWASAAARATTPERDASCAWALRAVCPCCAALSTSTRAAVWWAALWLATELCTKTAFWRMSASFWRSKASMTPPSTAAALSAPAPATATAGRARITSSGATSGSTDHGAGAGAHSTAGPAGPQGGRAAAAPGAAAPDQK